METRKGFFLFLLFSLFWLGGVKGEEEVCRQGGECIPCSENEKEEPYCILTGYRQECFEHPLSPPPRRSSHHQPSIHPTVRFVGCYPTLKNDSLSVGLFELVMLIVFMLAFSAVIERKRMLTEIQQRKIQSMIAV